MEIVWGNRLKWKKGVHTEYLALPRKRPEYVLATTLTEESDELALWLDMLVIIFGSLNVPALACGSKNIDPTCRFPTGQYTPSCPYIGYSEVCRLKISREFAFVVAGEEAAVCR